MYLPREGKLVAPALHMTCHCVRSVWMPRGGDQWIDCLKTSSVFHIVFIAPDVLASSIRFIDDTLAGAVHLLDAVGKRHLIRVGAVRGGCLSGSEEAWSTFAGVPVGHTAGSPGHKRRIEKNKCRSITSQKLAQGCPQDHPLQMPVFRRILQQFWGENTIC